MCHKTDRLKIRNATLSPAGWRSFVRRGNAVGTWYDVPLPIIDGPANPRKVSKPQVPACLREMVNWQYVGAVYRASGPIYFFQDSESALCLMLT